MSDTLHTPYLDITLKDVLRDPKRIAALAEAGLLHDGHHDALDNISVIAADLLGAPVALVSLVTSDRQHSAGGNPGAAVRGLMASVPLSDSFCKHVVADALPLVVEDARIDPRVCSIPSVRTLGIVAYLGVPLQLESGEVLGSLCVIDFEPRIWTESQQRGLERLARTTMTEIRNRRQMQLLEEASQGRRAAEQGFDRVFTALPLPTWVFDPSTLQILEVNSAACTTYGYDRDAFLAKTIGDLRPESEAARFADALRAVRLHPDDVRSSFHTHMRHDGTRLEVEVHTAPIIFRDRHARLAIIRDLTKEHATDRELLLLRTAIGRLNDIVLITEAEPITGSGPKVVFVNEAFARRTGYAADEIIGRTPRILQGPQTDRATLDRMRAAMERWEPVRAELVNYTKSGEPFWLELDIVPVADATGWFTHWIAVERDITERKRLEAGLQQAQRLEALGQFSGGIAHDFANITAIISASAALLAMRLEHRGEADADLEAIRSAAGRAGALVSQILAFSRRQVLDVRPISLPQLVRQTENLLRRLMDESVTLDIALPASDVVVLADETQIVQVLLNLAANARDSMPEGGRLLLTVEGPPGANCEFGRIIVRDTGHGIAAEHLALIFEPFFTTKGPGRGTGLGLATVYGIVKQLGGELRVQSTLGRGTTFEVDLPIAPVARANEADAPAVMPDVERSREATLAGLHVLLVEDEDALRRATQRLLQRFGVQVDVAVNGIEALQFLRDAQFTPDLVLTDIVMPGLGGRALAEAVRELYPALPVLFMSGYDAGYADTTAGEQLAVGHLQKPFDLEALLNAVADAVTPASERRLPSE
jgi:PAS domain S-box-containing protein